MSCRKLVVDTLPLADALPVQTQASPSDVFDAVPAFEVVTAESTSMSVSPPLSLATSTSWSVSASFSDSLPVASLSPVLAAREARRSRPRPPGC